MISIIVISSLIILGTYNYYRFGNPFETGYTYDPGTYIAYTKAKSYGLISPVHIPGNLYVFLFMPPDAVHQDQDSYVLKFPYLRANEWGMGIFFTSPLFLYLILTDKKKKYVVPAFITIPALLIIPLTYYTTGLWQYGYRYALDIYPFLMIILITIFREKGLPKLAKFFILYSIIFNLLFMYSIWYKYSFPI